MNRRRRLLTAKLCILSAAMMTRKFRSMFLLGAWAMSASAFAQDRAAAALDSLPQIKKIDQVAISPDGTKVAYIVEGELSIAAVAGGEPRRIAGEQKTSARDAAWSADSKEIVW